MRKTNSGLHFCFCLSPWLSPALLRLRFSHGFVLIPSPLPPILKVEALYVSLKCHLSTKLHGITALIICVYCMGPLILLGLQCVALQTGIPTGCTLCLHLEHKQ